MHKLNIFVYANALVAFSALTLLVGRQEGHPACKKWGDGEGGHWLVWMEWRPARWLVCLPLLIFPCTKSRLKRLNLTTLELRRLHIDLVWCYKIVFGLVDVNIDDFFALSPVSHNSGSQAQTVQTALQY